MVVVVVVMVVMVVVGPMFETVGVPGPVLLDFQASEAFRAWSRASVQTIAL